MSRLLTVALVGEGLLAVVASVWVCWRGLPLELGPVGRGGGMGLVAAVALGALNYAMLRLAPPVGPVRQIRTLYRETLHPLFSRATLAEVLGVSLAAGIGEELLFRGAVQGEWGLLVASVLFGLAHIGGRTSLAFGLWAGLMGLGLGALAAFTGGLLAPIVAHAAYDAAAIGYIRRDTGENEDDKRLEMDSRGSDGPVAERGAAGGPAAAAVDRRP